MKCNIIRLAILLLALTSLKAWAVLDLHVQESIVVYKTRGGTEVSQLVKGDVVVISPKTYGSYRKVLVTYDGKRQAGYIKSKDIMRSYIKDRDEEERALEGTIDYKKSYGLGLSLIGSYMRQGARTIVNDVDSTFDVTSLASFRVFFSVFFDFPLSETWTLRPYLAFRQTKFRGQSQLQEAVVTDAQDVTIKQNLLGVGLLVKRYWSARSNFWMGAALEAAKGNSVEITMGGEPFETQDTDLPFFVITEAATGWDIQAGKWLVLVPEFRLGVIANQDPYIIVVEGFFSLAIPL